MSSKANTQKSPRSAAATGKAVKGFTDEERAAMKERARELKAEARGGSRDGRADPFDRQSQRAGPVAENVVRDAGLREGR